MEAPGRNHAWEGERLPHQHSSADGEPSSSGRVELRRSGSGEERLRTSLRGCASLPRVSRNGSESLPMQSAEDVIPQEGQASGRAQLRARAPSAARGHPQASGRRARRGSIADFLGFKSGPASQEFLSASASRDIALQAAGPAPSAVARSRSRRSSFLNTFGIGSPQGEQDNNNNNEGGCPGGSGGGCGGGGDSPPPLNDSMTAAGASADPPTKPPQSASRRRRASMLDLFRASHSLEPGSAGPGAGAAGAEGADGAAATGAASEQLLRTKSSGKSRRASVIDFFRSSNTGLTTMDEPPPGSAPISMSRRLARGESGVGRSQRRRSVIDILGHSSKKVFAKLMNQEFEDESEEDELGVEGKLWFTSLSDFKPLTFKYLSGRYSSAFFACSVKTGQHYILKKFEKGKMSLSDERGVRRALHFAEVLEHEHIVQCCGLWEDEEALYIVEEYAVKGDLLQDSMSHPEKYTESFMATKVVKPLLDVLVYLHGAHVVHRAIFPEYVMFGREDKLKLGHLTSAIDQRMDPPSERIPFLDYMAPEMLAVRGEEAYGGGFGGGFGGGGGGAMAAVAGGGGGVQQGGFGGGGGGGAMVMSPAGGSVQAGGAGRNKGRTVRLSALSNDGFAAAQRAGPTSSFAASSGTPVFDFGSFFDSRTSRTSRTSQQQQHQLLHPQQQQQQQQQPGNGVAASNRGATSSGAQLLDLFGLTHGSEAEGSAPSGSKSPISRASTRSAFNLFRPARRPSPPPPQSQQSQTSLQSQQQQQRAPQGFLSPSDDDGRPSREASGFAGSAASATRRLRGESAAADAPWLLPPDGGSRRSSQYGGGGGASHGGPPRRRKSALDEMSAPWLRPVGSEPQTDFDTEEAAAAAASNGPGDGAADARSALGAAAGASAASGATETPVMETRSAGVTADGSGDAADAAAAAGSPRAAAAAAVNDAGVVGNARSPSQLLRSPAPRAAGAGAGAVAAAAELDNGGDHHSLVERLDPDSQDGLPSAAPPPSPPSPPSPQQLQRQPSMRQPPQRQPSLLLQRQYSKHMAASAAVDGASSSSPQQQQQAPSSPSPPSPSPSSPPPLHRTMSSMSSCRRTSSVQYGEPTGFRPTSSFRAGGGSGGGAAAAAGGGAGGSPVLASSTRPGSALGPPPLHHLRPGSALGPQPEAGNLPDRDDCLPGYAAEPAPSLLQRGNSGFGYLQRMPTSRLAPVAGGGSPGPVTESLLAAAEHTPMLPYDSGTAPPELSEVKRVRGTVSFTNGGAAAAEAAAAAADAAADAYGDDARTTRSSRMVVSREASVTSGGGGGGGGQVMMRTMRTVARNITVKLGMVLGGRGDLLMSPGGGGGASHGESSGWGEAADAAGAGGGAGGGGGGGGGGYGREPSPRPSCPGDATAIIMPNNPWEWQDHYNEKVDLWQVGCLVHEILCLSLPFETEDKLLACALILWADIVSFPDHLSPECHDFMRACLTKNPAERPSAADLLHHPWIVRHAAGETLKSVRQGREEDGLAAASHARKLTVLQRAASVVGLGWAVGAGGGAGGAAAPAAGGGGGGGGGGWTSPLSWLLRPWSSKVTPAGAGGGGAAAADEGEAKLALAMAMVQEQQAAAAGLGDDGGSRRRMSVDRRRSSERRKSSDVEAARRSLEVIRHHQQQQAQAHANPMSPGSFRASGGDPSPRWGAML
ncbi:hypothetical protein PLESTM_000569200 [Pleodorina starrii]|nr:hypothetical protein PLESTM_000569200 [Pleodorina starrii]